VGSYLYTPSSKKAALPVKNITLLEGFIFSGGVMRVLSLKGVEFFFSDV